MTKKDFQEIADAVAESRRMIEYAWKDGTASRAAALTALEVAAKQLATACARQYKGGYGFNRQRFVDACGFPEA